MPLDKFRDLQHRYGKAVTKVGLQELRIDELVTLVQQQHEELEALRSGVATTDEA